MELQSLLNAAIGIAIAIGGWFARQLWDNVQKLKDDVHQIEIDLPQHYIRKDDFKDGLKEIKDILADIFREINALKKDKADK